MTTRRKSLQEKGLQSSIFWLDYPSRPQSFKTSTTLEEAHCPSMGTVRAGVRQKERASWNALGYRLNE
jgi:hypothetical protein